MSEYLSALLDRAQGRGPVLERRKASRFEEPSEAVAVPVEERVEVGPASARPAEATAPAPSSPRLPAPPSPVSDSAPRRFPADPVGESEVAPRPAPRSEAAAPELAAPPRVRSEVPTPPEARTPSLPALPPVPEAPGRRSEPAVPAPLLVVPAPTPRFADRPAAPAPLPPTVPAAPVLAPVPRVLERVVVESLVRREEGSGARENGRSEVVPSRASVAERAETPAGPPAIHVSIGRIEVRATTGAAAPRTSREPARPKLELDAYLKTRNGGGR